MSAYRLFWSPFLSPFPPLYNIYIYILYFPCLDRILFHALPDVVPRVFIQGYDMCDAITGRSGGGKGRRAERKEGRERSNQEA